MDIYVGMKKLKIYDMKKKHKPINLKCSTHNSHVLFVILS